MRDGHDVEVGLFRCDAAMDEMKHPESAETIRKAPYQYRIMPVLRDYAERENLKSSKELEGNGIFVWSIIGAKDRTELYAILAQKEQDEEDAEQEDEQWIRDTQTRLKEQGIS